MAFGNTKVFRAKAYALALLSLLGVWPGHGWAADEGAECGAQQSSISKIVCSDPNLSTMQRDLQQLASDTSARFRDPEALKALAERQKDWRFDSFWRCINFPFTTLADPHVAAARQCIAKEYETRRNFLIELPTDVKPHAPYLLSGFERAMLAYDATIHGSSLGYDVSGVSGQLLKRSLNRVFSAIIKPGRSESGNDVSRLKEFTRAASGLGSPYHIDEARYLFGKACERHACFHEAVLIVDLKTGEIVLADIWPNHGTLMLKECTGADIRHYAHATFPDKAFLKEVESEGCEQTSNE